MDNTDVKVAGGLAAAGKWLVGGSKTTWKSVKKTIFTFFGGLVMEKKDGEWTTSIGRISFWLAMCPAIYIWIKGGGSLEAGEAIKDIAPNHLTILLALAGYNMGTKAMKTANDIFGKNDGPG